MGRIYFGILMGSVLFTSQVSAGADDDRSAASAAARELSRQLEFFQRAIAVMPGPTDRRDVFEQAEKVQFDLIYLQQQLKRKVSREALYLAFDKMDQRLSQLLENLQDFEKWDKALRMTAGRVKAAEHDLHYALSGGDGDAGRERQSLSRQTEVLLTRTDDMESLVRFVFTDKDKIEQWAGDIKSLRRKLTAFQTLQKDKASRDDLKKQFSQADDAWENLVPRFKELPGEQYFLLQGDAAQIDRVFERLARAFGIKGKRARLPGNYFP